MATTTQIKHCARCAKQLKHEQWLYSHHTGLRYCLDIDACGRRAKRRKK